MAKRTPPQKPKSFAARVRRPLGRMALVAEFGEKQVIAWEAAECFHDSVDWGPVEIEYGSSEGPAAVWQEGTCNGCGRLVQCDFVAGIPHTVTDEVGGSDGKKSPG